MEILFTKIIFVVAPELNRFSQKMTSYGRTYDRESNEWSDFNTKKRSLKLKMMVLSVRADTHSHSFIHTVYSIFVCIFPPYFLKASQHHTF